MLRFFWFGAALLAIVLPDALGQTGGRDLYIAKCSACHAPDGSGNSTVGRSLKLNNIRPAIASMTDDQLRGIILNGKGKMPANKKLDDEKVRTLILFLQDLNDGNPDTGRAVAEAQAQPLRRVDTVFQDKCSACHGPDGTGRTTIGKSLKIPDLTSAAIQNRSADELAQVISEGKARMPSYSKKFNPVQVGQLVSYIRGFPKAGDAIQPAQSTKSFAPVAQLPSSPPAEIVPPLTMASSAPSPPGNTVLLSSPKEVSKTPEAKPVTVPKVRKTSLNGRQIYIAKCSACHSSDGTGTGTIGKSMRIPSLTSPQVQGQSDEMLAEAISNGVRKMPPYNKKLRREEIELLIAYIRELGQKK